MSANEVHTGPTVKIFESPHGPHRNIQPNTRPHVSPRHAFGVANEAKRQFDLEIAVSILFGGWNRCLHHGRGRAFLHNFVRAGHAATPASVRGKLTKLLRRNAFIARMYAKCILGFIHDEVEAGRLDVDEVRFLNDFLIFNFDKLLDPLLAWLLLIESSFS